MMAAYPMLQWTNNDVCAWAKCEGAPPHIVSLLPVWLDGRRLLLWLNSDFTKYVGMRYGLALANRRNNYVHLQTNKTVKFLTMTTHM